MTYGVSYIKSHKVTVSFLKLYFHLCHYHATKEMLLSPCQCPLPELGDSWKHTNSQTVRWHQDLPGPYSHIDCLRSNFNIPFFSRLIHPIILLQLQSIWSMADGVAFESLKAVNKVRFSKCCNYPWHTLHGTYRQVPGSRYPHHVHPLPLSWWEGGRNFKYAFK